MKISLAWLNEYLDKPVTADEVERFMTAQGMPIESRQPVGSSGDVMLDVEVTSNRPDCLSHVGIAREVAAGSGRGLKLPEVTLPAKGGPAVESLAGISNERLDLCPLYTARVIRGVKVGPSPAWLVQRLEAVGLRSVNNVVDVTNFVLLELGQPLHAFDLNKLADRRIVVRTARPGETFEAIDGSKHKLTGEMLVIADAQNPVAVAGVMGGRHSEVTLATTDILLESAMFDPLSVRRTSRGLKLSSDSSYHFERGVDPRGIASASCRAAALMLELAHGELASGVINAGQPLPELRVVAMRVERCRQILGLELSVEEIVAILKRLGLAPQPDAVGQSIACTIPSFRLDLHREIDLIEEIARLHGIDQVPVRQKISIVARPVQEFVEARRKLSQTLIAHGYHETINFSFVAPKVGEPFLPPGAEPLLVEDERRKAEPMLRPALLPSLLLCRKSNQDVGNVNVRLFETAAVWSRRGGQIVEQRKIGLLADAPDGQQAVRDMRGTIEELLANLAGEIPLEWAEAEHAFLSVAADLRIKGQWLGTMGLIAPAIQKSFDLAMPVVVADLDFDALLATYPPKRVVRQLPRFPGIERDVSVVVEEPLPWVKIRSEVLAVRPALLEELQFLMAYRGKPIPPGKKSVSFRMTFRDPAVTLRHEQVDGQIAAVVERLAQTLHAELRK